MRVCLSFNFFEPCKKHLLLHPPLLNTRLKGLPLSLPGVRAWRGTLSVRDLRWLRGAKRHTSPARGHRNVFYCFVLGADTSSSPPLQPPPRPGSGLRPASSGCSRGLLGRPSPGLTDLSEPLIQSSSSANRYSRLRVSQGLPVFGSL